MTEREPMKDVLSDLVRVFNQGESIEVRFEDGSPHAALDGSYIAVNPDVGEWYDVEVNRANEIRLLRDTVSHEVEHIRSSDLRAKEAIVNDYLPDGVNSQNLIGATNEEKRNAQVAGQVYNIAEDAYVNHVRCSERPGLRSTFAFKAQILAGDDDVSELPRSEAILAGIQQVSLLGFAHGYQDLDHDLRRLLAFVREHLDAYRREDDPEARGALVRRMTDAVIQHLPDVPERPDEFEDLLDALQDASMSAQNDADEVPDDMDTEDLDAAGMDLDAEDLPDADDLEPEQVENLPQADDDDAEDHPETIEGAPEDDDDGEGGDGVPDDYADREPEDRLDAMDGGDASPENLDADDEQDEDGSGGEGGEGEGPGEDENAEDDAQSDEDGDQSDEAGGESDGRGGDESAGEGDDAGDLSEGDTDADDLADTMDGMDSQDEDGTGNEWHDVADDEDVTEASERDKRRAENLQDRDDFRNDTDVGKRMNYRDERIKNNRSSGVLDGQVDTGYGCEAYTPTENGDTYTDANADKVRDLLRETGLAEDVREAFSRFKTEDVTVAREDGDELNIDRVVDHMAGDYGEQNVYNKTYTSATGGRTVGVALDASGSMNQNGELEHGAMVDAKVALGALHLATHEMEDDLVASSFYKSNTGLITGPDESFDWSHLDAATPEGGTPTAPGILDVADLLDRSGGKELVMLVVTDGKPNTGHYDLDGDTETEDAAIATNMARSDGIKVIGVGVGDGVSEEQMQVMFGRDGYVTTGTDTLVDDLIRVYREQLDIGGEHVRFE